MAKPFKDKTDAIWREAGVNTNGERAEKAETQGVSGYYEEQWELCAEHRQQALGDALANLMHYARCNRIDFEKALESGRFHFQQEIRGIV